MGDRQVPKIITQEVVRHQPVVQTQIQERVVEVPQVQVVQPVINERIVETRQQEVSYQTSAFTGAPVQRVASHGLVGGVVAAAPVVTGGYTTGVATGVTGGYTTGVATGVTGGSSTGVVPGGYTTGSIIG